MLTGDEAQLLTGESDGQYSPPPLDTNLPSTFCPVSPQFSGLYDSSAGPSSQFSSIPYSPQRPAMTAYSMRENFSMPPPSMDSTKAFSPLCSSRPAPLYSEHSLHHPPQWSQVVLFLPCTRLVLCRFITLPGMLHNPLECL